MLKFFKKLTKPTLLCMLLILFTVGTLYGCSSKKVTSKNPSVKEISKKIEQAIDMSNMKPLDSSKLQKLYKINPDDLDDFSIYAPTSNIKADELAILKVKDANKLNEIKEKVSKRVENQSNSFKDYLPNEYTLIEKHVLKVNGSYILLVISKDSEKVEKVFDESFK